MKRHLLAPLFFLTIGLMLLSPSSVFGQLREWTSAHDSSRKIKGKLLRSNGEMVILQLENGRSVQFEITKLSKKDQYFIKNGKEMPPPPGPMAKPEELIHFFVFDEEPDQVFVRMKANRGLRGGTGKEIMRGRMGINDMFHIMVNGIRYGLFFEFGKGEEGLIEVSLQSVPYEFGDYDKALLETWEHMRAEIEERYGKPALEGGYPARASLVEGQSISSDIWQTPKGEIYLGVGKADGKYSCVVKTQVESYLTNQ